MGKRALIGILLLESEKKLKNKISSLNNEERLKLLDMVWGILVPYVGPVVLLIVGIVPIFKNIADQPRVHLKLPLVLVIAAIPFAIHMAMYTLTYYTGTPPQRTFWGPLTPMEWLVFFAGFLLIGVGIYLLNRRHAVPPSSVVTR
jgi:hypothetical protein